MQNAIVEAIEQRVSVNRFDPDQPLDDTRLGDLVRLATRAPSAYNLQNWRFVAVRSAAGKMRLRAAAYDQAKVSEAAVTFIVVGQMPDHAPLAERLQPSVDAGFMPEATARAWVRAVRDTYGERPRLRRDEAIRSATLGAATLMFAASAFGLASGAMVGFDAERVAHEFELGEDEIPVMLLAVGRAAAGNWPQKPRRPLGQVLAFA